MVLIFKIAESICEPVRFLMADNSGLEIGKIAQITNVDGCPKATLCLGSNPLGVVTKIDEKYNLAYIAFETMILQTNLIAGKKFETGNGLYCNSEGILSSEKLNDNSVVLAYVITGPDSNKTYIEVNWI